MLALICSAIGAYLEVCITESTVLSEGECTLRSWVARYKFWPNPKSGSK